MSVMNRITSGIERWIAPAANKIANQKYIKVIQSTFLTLIPFFTIGSFALIIISPPVDFTTLDPGFGRSFFQGWQAVADFTYPALNVIYATTIGAISVYVAGGLAFYLARHHKMTTFIPVALALATFLIMVGLNEEEAIASQYFSGTGLFTAIVSGIAAFELYRFLYDKRVGRIELSGNGVPPALSESLASLVPITIVLVAAGAVAAVTEWLSGAPFPDLISILMAPVIDGVDTIWAVVILALIVMILWWFGIHDTVVTGPLSPFFLSNLAANSAAFAAGTAAVALPFVLTEPFWWTFMAIGGSGATLGLAFLAVWSRSKHIKTVGRLSAVPALFNINEPLIFGLPLMYNPTLFFPFVFVMPINGGIVYALMESGFISRTFADGGWNMPSPVGALLSTLDWKAALIVVGLILLDVLIYYPFFKVYEKQKVAEEKADDDPAPANPADAAELANEAPDAAAPTAPTAGTTTA